MILKFATLFNKANWQRNLFVSGCDIFTDKEENRNVIKNIPQEVKCVLGI